MPINIAYNHHHGVSINGKGARMETMDRAEAEAAGLRGLKLSQKDIAKEHRVTVSAVSRLVNKSLKNNKFLNELIAERDRKEQTR